MKRTGQIRDWLRLAAITGLITIGTLGCATGSRTADDATAADAESPATVAEPDDRPVADGSGDARDGQTQALPELTLDVPADEPLPNDLALELMYALMGNDPEQVAATRDAILRSGDQRFVPVFLDLVWARQLGIVRGPSDGYLDALETLSGEEFGVDWFSWIEWYGGTDLAPPPGYTGWKGRLLSPLDDEFGYFLRDGLPARIRVEEVLWGGVPVDGIPPLEHPPLLAAADADYLQGADLVFGIVVNGEARAYPLRIVDNHELVNDTVGGVPVSLIYCTLCGAGIAYDDRAPNGETYSFGTSGFLYRSNKLMYDRSTGTLWNQLTGEPVLGTLARLDLRLNQIPVVLSAWDEWLRRHPDTFVLDVNTGVYPAYNYEPGILYGNYFASPDTMFPVWNRSDALGTKDFVYTLRIDGIPKAYDVDVLAEEQVVNDTVGSTDVVLVATQGVSRVEGRDRRAGQVSYSAGAEVRAYARRGLVFSSGADPYTVTDAAGTTWSVTEENLIAPDGTSLPRLPGHLAYWFGWFAFFPDTLVYPAPE